MTRKKNTKQGKVTFQGYIDVNLLKEHKERIQSGWEGDEGAFEWIESMALAGYSVKLDYDAKSQAMRVTLYGASSKENRGYAMTTWAANSEKALLVAQFKHEIICNSGSWEVEEDDGLDWFK